ncbi:unnamed protein product [Ascophyllum nodosum]
MDSHLEQEIARLSRSPAEQSSPHQQARPAASPKPGSIILHPQNGAAAERRPADGNFPPNTTRLRRGSSGSSSGDLSRSGSGLRMGSPAGVRSPQPSAAAVLAGTTISELQMPIVPQSMLAQQQQQQHQHHQQQHHQHQHHQQPQGIGVGSGGVGTVAGTGGPAAAAMNGRQRPRLAANGEKVAGPRPSVNGEKVSGFVGSSRPIPHTGVATEGAKATTATGRADAAAAARAAAAAAAAAVVVPARMRGRVKEEETWKKSEAALKKKEQSVRNALKEKQRTLQQESILLATVDRELAQLALVHQTEINDLRRTLEVVDRELAFLDRDAQRKLEAFEKARNLLSEKVTQKQTVTTRLTELILASEKQRDAKLNEIMKKMSAEQKTGGASYPG